MADDSTYLVIWNPTARRAGVAAELRSRLEADRRFELRETAAPDDARRWAREAIEDERIDTVVAAGGDGTIHAVVNGLAEGSGPIRNGSLVVAKSLAILPLGTANDLCRSLLFPLDPMPAFELIDAPRRRRIDLARIEGPGVERIFVNAASGGNSTRVTELLTAEIKQRWGPWAYLRGVVDVVSDLTDYDLRLQHDDQPEEQIDAWNFVVANGPFSAGGIEVAPGADMADGLLDLIVIRGGTPLDAADLAGNLLLGNYLEHEQVVHRRVVRARLETHPASATSVDGEPIANQPLTFSVLPAALEVLVPEEG